MYCKDFLLRTFDMLDMLGTHRSALDVNPKVEAVYFEIIVCRDDQVEYSMFVHKKPIKARSCASN